MPKRPCLRAHICDLALVPAYRASYWFIYKYVLFLSSLPSTGPKPVDEPCGSTAHTSQNPYSQRGKTFRRIPSQSRTVALSELIKAFCIFWTHPKYVGLHMTVSSHWLDFNWCNHYLRIPMQDYWFISADATSNVEIKIILNIMPFIGWVA